MSTKETVSVTFHGAVREVTGSMHQVTTPTDMVLLDCGMFQGRRKVAAEKNRSLPVAGERVSNVVLSHAHIDHSGRIPLLARNGFAGRVICTRATADAAEYLLLDSAHIQESDAAYLNYKTARSALAEIKRGKSGRRVSKEEMAEIKRLLKTDRHRLNPTAITDALARHGIDAVEPLYTTPDAERALAAFDGYPYRHAVAVGQDLLCTFYEAGHILGSAVSALRYTGAGRPQTILYTGDIGRFDKPIIRDPALDFMDDDRNVDLMIMESTYGDRRHEPVADTRKVVRDVLLRTHERGGTVLIPAFAFGRTQELLYVLHGLYDDGEVPRMPIYVDSPLATRLTRVFGEHPEVYDRETHETFLQQGKNPFAFSQVNFTVSVEESMALMKDDSPQIVIASSGMCEAGRILHHLRYKVHNPGNTILIVGYMAKNTLGRRLAEEGEAYTQAGRTGDPPILRILNKSYPLKAEVINLGGFSAHADADEMIRFLKRANFRVRRIAVVHGEEDSSLAFADRLRREGYTAFVPTPGQTIDVDEGPG